MLTASINRIPIDIMLEAKKAIYNPEVLDDQDRGRPKDTPVVVIILQLKMGQPICSKCEHQRHNLFYVDNTVQVRGGLRGTLSEEECVVCEQIGRCSSSYSSKRGGR